MGLNYYALPKVSDTEKKRIIEAVNIDDFDTACKLMPNRIHIDKFNINI